MIELQSGQFGWDYLIVNCETGDDILVQSDHDYPGVATTFGWDGAPDDIDGAAEYLDSNIGAVADDPGYFC